MLAWRQPLMIESLAQGNAIGRIAQPMAPTVTIIAVTTRMPLEAQVLKHMGHERSQEGFGKHRSHRDSAHH